MSIFDAFTVGASALQAQSTKLGSISTNIANTSTVGYKADVTNFADLVTSDNAFNYSPGGVQSSNQQLVDVQGTITPDTTTTPTDLAVSGPGMIPVTSSALSGSQLLYTRAGSFTQDSNGYLVNGSGFFLQGWPVSSTGALPGSLSTASLRPVNVANLTELSQTTNSITVQANLLSSQAANSAPYSPTIFTENMASGTVTPQFTLPVTAVDSLGASHSLTAGFLKTGTNSWAVEVYAQPASDVTTTGGQVAFGNITFNGDGSLASVSSGLQNIGITWSANGATPPATPTPSTIAVNWGTIGQSNGITQVDSSYSGNATSNGFTAGQLSSVTIDASGNVIGNFNNNTSQKFYKIPLADFHNPEDLQSMTGNVYLQTNNSGTVSLVQAGQTNGSTFVPSALEQSNVDLSFQLSNLIVAQQAYDAGSKIVTVSDTMLQDLNSMGTT